MTISADRMANVFQTRQDDAESQHHNHERTASLSDVERAVLSALFIDAPRPTPMSLSSPFPGQTKQQSRRTLNDEILFSIPRGLSESQDGDAPAKNRETSSRLSTALPPKRPAVKKKPKDYRLHVGLWQAHEDGITPKILSRMASIASSTKEADTDRVDSTINDDDNKSFRFEDDGDDDNGDNDDSSSMKSLRGSQSSLSWGNEDEEESNMEHFDAWQVLKDEYAQEYGFDYRPSGSSVDDSAHAHNTFKIIGTSADDKSSHPHVVSPPLLDSVMSHLPEVREKEKAAPFLSFGT